MIIPYEKLSPAALRGLIEEAVTRDGTELTDAEVKIVQVMRQLERGTVVITYDLDTGTCQLVSADAARETAAGEG